MLCIAARSRLPETGLSTPKKTSYLPSEQQGAYTEPWRTSAFGQKRPFHEPWLRWINPMHTARRPKLALQQVVKVRSKIFSRTLVEFMRHHSS
jgi:hypothetical protein